MRWSYGKQVYWMARRTTSPGSKLSPELDIFSRPYLGLRGYLFYSILEKCDRGKYQEYRQLKRRGDTFMVDSTEWDCHPCIFLNRGESVKMRMPLLSNAILEKGNYMLEVFLHSPASIFLLYLWTIEGNIYWLFFCYPLITVVGQISGPKQASFKLPNSGRSWKCPGDKHLSIS